MSTSEIALKAHLLRRAGFGASRSELEKINEKDYESIVEDLLNPDRFEDLDEDYIMRYNPDVSYHDGNTNHAGRWVWRMINSKRPLEEKMALFWHHVFATAWYKSEHSPSVISQIESFRKNGLSNIKQVLLDLSKDPAMNYWLDNCENHADQPNENWGRELLELFSMGVGNYTEDDIKNAARAFTGWTFEQPLPLYPYGHYESAFIYDENDHDDSEKTFLGKTGKFNGEDIIDIILEQPACPRFIARHLYNFFVADEPQVPAWQVEPPLDPEAIEILAEALVESDFEIKPVLRTLFNSKFFKESMYLKVKSPVEVIVGTLRATGELLGPDPRLVPFGQYPEYMGQGLHNPPSVEGWNSGKEWVLIVQDIQKKN